MRISVGVGKIAVRYYYIKNAWHPHDHLCERCRSGQQHFTMFQNNCTALLSLSLERKIIHTANKAATWRSVF